MDTISKPDFKFKRIFSSLSSKVFLICTLVAAILIFSYTFAVYSSVSSTTYKHKEAELREAASDLSSAFSASGAISQSALSSTAGIHRRIVITDENLSVIYDTSDVENLESKSLVIPATLTALRGEESFVTKAASDHFQSTFAAPIIRNDKIVGVFLILEQDPSLYTIFKSTTSSLLVTAFIALFLFALIFGLITYLLRRRISELMTSIKESRTDEKAEEIPNLHRDEIAPVVDEFNNIYEQLNYVQQMRRAFVSDASHELRTPLSAIKLLCESITGTENMDPETTKEFLEDIILEVDRMSHTAEKLLVLSRLDNSSLTALSPVPLSDVVHKTITALTPFAEDKNITIESYIEEDCTILAEMEGTNQIIGNIIDNAIKYNNHGGCIKIYVFKKDGTCRFIADDTGIGVAPEFRKQVFERFYRIDKSRKHDGRGGSGLGLAIVKRNIESFGGSVEISDSVLGGSRFTVIFPSSPAEEGYA